MSENQTKKGKCSSWLIEAASYGAEPVEPVPNWFSWLIKNPKFGQKVPKPFITNQQKSCVAFIIHTQAIQSSYQREEKMMRKEKKHMKTRKKNCK